MTEINKELCLKFSSEQQAFNVLTRKSFLGSDVVSVPVYKNIDVLGKVENSDDFLVNVYLQEGESCSMISQYEVFPKTKNRVCFFNAKETNTTASEDLQEP